MYPRQLAELLDERTPWPTATAVKAARTVDRHPLNGGDIQSGAAL